MQVARKILNSTKVFHDKNTSSKLKPQDNKDKSNISQDRQIDHKEQAAKKIVAIRAIKNCTCQKLRQDKSRQQFSISLNVGKLCAHRNTKKKETRQKS